LKPVILIRQDEAFFNENATNTLKWVGQIGNTHYYQKYGLGLMILAFKSPEFGCEVCLSMDL
jgi:hypothetical protein